MVPLERCRLSGNSYAEPAAVTDDKARPDWERIQYDYRAGVLSLREIASQHGITQLIFLMQRSFFGPHVGSEVGASHQNIKRGCTLMHVKASAEIR